MRTFYFSQEMAYSSNKPLTSDKTKDTVTTMISRTKDTNKAVLAPCFNLSLPQITINLMGMVIGHSIQNNKKQYEIQVNHWKSRVMALDKKNIYARSCISFFNKWAKLYNPNIKHNSEDLYTFTKLTLMQFIQARKINKDLFDIMYLILLHIPNIDAKIDGQMHKLFLTAMRAKKILELDHKQQEEKVYHKTAVQSQSVPKGPIYFRSSPAYL